MLDKQSFLSDKIIRFSFYLLFFLTPLIWTPLNYELFEYNKMTFVYLLTILICTIWALKMISQKQLLIKRTPLDIPLLLFLGANILSTIFSIDPYTSIWGYYSRSNGGLLSIVSYLLLYFALVSNFAKDDVIKFLKVALWGGLIVSLWAIPEHFGVSPSCIILHGQFNADCWVQNVQARVFATLGQPNWLAAYLSLLIFPALYFLLTSKSLFYYLLPITFYLAFTFTYSRGAALGFLVGMGVFLASILLNFSTKIPKLNLKSLPQPLIKILLIFLVANIIFGSALTRFQLSQFLPHTATTESNQSAPAILTQLENGGTESGQIRIIVWQGAIDIFKHYPLFGSGVETFAYTYYQYRPLAQNLVSEWDFLYNKAHNEYLNYLANTGIVGFSSYMAIIISFIVWSIKYLAFSKAPDTKYKILIASLLAGYISYLVQNAVGFSVVVIALFFYLFPALAFVWTEELKPLKLPAYLPITLLKRFFTSIAAKPLIIIIGAFLFLTILKYWYADTAFSAGEKFADMGEVAQAYSSLSEAHILNPGEPFYQSELGYAAAAIAVGLKDSDATLSGQLRDQATSTTEQVLKEHPKNVSFYRSAIRTYYLLSSIDESFTQKALETLDNTLKLSPTDAKLLYNKAIILGQTDKREGAINTLKQAIKFKSNYREAYIALGLFLFDQKDYEDAVANMNQVLQLIPGDQEALQYLNDWGKQGIATKSANL